MSEVKTVPKRSEIPVELTWDLSLIFKDEAAFEAAFAKIESQAADFAAYQGTLGQSAPALLAALEAKLALERQLENLYVYTSMKNDQDTTQAKYQGLNARAQKLFAQTAAALAWFEPEFLQIDEATLQDFYQAEPKLQQYRHLLDDLMKSKAHVLSAKEEALLAGASDIFDASQNVFGVLNNADLKFPFVLDDEGNQIELSNGVYAKLLESTKPSVRKEAFEKLYQVYGQFQHTFATTLATHVRMHNFNAKIRNYPSAQAASLSRNDIDVQVYETLLTQVQQNLPLLHRYVTLRKKVLKLAKVHMYDLYTPITGEPSLSFTYEEAKDITLKALAVLGDDYISHVKEAFDQRWIDVMENQGKRSGAYSSGAYDTPPYILLNWQDNLDNLYTLVHELGHSLHSYYTRNNQPYQYGDYSIFVAEIASTTNENLLTQYLLEHETDPKVQAYIINHYLDGFKGTVFRQTQFAQFEKWLHEQDAKGQPLTAQYISEYYGKLNKQYYGPDIEEDSQIALEWSRIPHFYYNFYVYQYATGFAAASTLAQNILDDDAKHTQAYLDYLKAGSSDYPINVMKKAGVDMTQSQYLDEAFAIFAARLEQLENLLAAK